MFSGSWDVRLSIQASVSRQQKKYQKYKEENPLYLFDI